MKRWIWTFLGVFSIFAVSFPVLADPDTTGLKRRAVYLTSVPEGARVFINGEEKGYTPLEDSLALGIGDRIEAYADGFLPWRTVLTGPVEADTLAIDLERQKARLTVFSNQLSAIGAKVKAHFVDGDTAFTGFLATDMGGLACELDVYVGKYRLEIVRPDYEPFAVDLWVPERGQQIRAELTPQPVRIQTVNREGLQDLAEMYRMDSARLLSGGLAAGGGEAESGPQIRLFDDRITPFLSGLERYAHHADELVRLMNRTGSWDPQVTQAVAQIYAYQGLLLGKYRRFSEAHQAYEKGRELSSVLEEEESPISYGGENTTLKTAMAYAEGWYERLGRVDVTVGPLWTEKQDRRSIRMRIEPIQMPSEKLFATGADQVLRDSLIVFAQTALQDSIRSRATAFSLFLPKGMYRLRDEEGLLTSQEFLVDRAAVVDVRLRVNLWLPEAKTASDTVQIRAVEKGQPGPPVDADELTFGEEYELVIHTGAHKRVRQRILFYRASSFKPELTNVTAIPAMPGEPCLYFKDGPYELREQSWIQRSGKLKYLIIPIGAALGVLAL